jgi:hypothetical protein
MAECDFFLLVVALGGGVITGKQGAQPDQGRHSGRQSQASTARKTCTPTKREAVESPVINARPSIHDTGRATPSRRKYQMSSPGPAGVEYLPPGPFDAGLALGQSGQSRAIHGEQSGRFTANSLANHAQQRGQIFT